MTLSRTNIVLASLLVIVAILATTTRVDYSRSNIEILPDMKYTPAWMTYAQNPVFVNGRTLQAPVPGTIARGQRPLHFESTEEDALRAGVELQNPYGHPDSESAQLQDSIRLGGDIYRVFCISCHGVKGAGDGPVPLRGFVPPPSLVTGKSREMKDGQLFHILTYGQNIMSSFAGQLSPAQRWNVINYIRNMQANYDMSVDAELADADVDTQSSDDANEANGQDDGQALLNEGK